MPNTVDFIIPIPPDYAHAIGQAVAAFALLEHSLQEATYKLLRITGKQGRVAVREPDICAYVSMMGTLFELRGVYPICFKKLKAGLAELESERNLIAHGIWTPAPWPIQHLWRVRETKGNWNSGPFQGTPRKVRPEGMIKTLRALRDTYDAISKKVAFGNQIREFVEGELPPSL